MVDWHPMNRRNIDGGHIRLTVLRGVPRGSVRSRWTIPVLSVVTFLVAAGAIALYWVEVFGPIFAKPMDPKAKAAYLEWMRDLGEKARVEAEIGEPGPVQLTILEAARREVERGVTYSDKYYTIPFPGGDVPPEIGASTDLVVRALRSVGLDLQAAIHEDRKLNPDRYPTQRKRRVILDPSIDHRRVANVFVWLKNHAQELTTRTDPESLRRYHPGDLILWGLDGNRFPVHLGVVSDKRNEDGVPYALDLNRKDGTASESHLVTDWYVSAHFRITEVPAVAQARPAPQTRPGGAGAPEGGTPRPR